MELTLIQRAEDAERATAADEFRIISEAALAIFGWQDERYKRVLHLLEAGASLDAAMQLAEPFMLVALSDIAADGLTGCCLCSDTASNPPKEHWGVPSERGGSRESILARAVCAAALRARAAS